MKSLRTRMARGAALFGAAWVAACFETAEPSLQGPGSETVGLAGTAAYSEGNPAIGVVAIARPAGYLPAPDEGTDKDSLHGVLAVTDSSGRYRFKGLPPGAYLVEIKDAFGRSALVSCTVTKGPVNAPDAYLRPVGGLIGSVRRPKGSGANAYVRIRGLDRLDRLGPGDTDFVFPGLPPGRLDLAVTSADPFADSVVVTGVEVRSDSLESLGQVNIDAFSREDYGSLKQARRILIRAAAAGLDSGMAVRGFPLLVRLEAGSFPFASAAPDGSDLRFTDAAGSRLPFEIETWDASAEKAAIWVRLDSLRGGNDQGYIRMLWGREAARPLSHGAWVFDTADGHRGVWHLHETGSETPRFRDASAWRNHAHPQAPAAVRSTASPLHLGAELDGREGHIVSSRFDRAPQVFSLSFWFRAAAPGKLLSFESSKSGRLSAAFDRHLWVAPDSVLRFGVFNADPPEGDPVYMRILASGEKVLDGQWHHATAVQDPAVGQSLFLDGVLVGANPLVNHSADYSGYWHMGSGTVGLWQEGLVEPHFQGGLDEVRVSHGRISPAWVKLSYENQKPGSDLLYFEPDR